MCLVVLALHVHPRFPLVVLSNRDEFYARPAKTADSWEDEAIFGGRDLERRGTWLGIAHARPRGPFALVTNVRSPSARKEGRSRGELVRRTLTEGFDAIDTSVYPAFNLLFGDATAVFSADESGAPPKALGPGIHGLSNARMDVAWPKVTRLERALEALLSAPEDALDMEAALAALRDDTRADPASLPDTGVGPSLELALSAPFLALDAYGTRASTVLVYDANGAVSFVEQSYGPGGVARARVERRLSLS